MKEKALKCLRQALKRSDAVFYQGQWESIEYLFNRSRVLIVQRTGWRSAIIDKHVSIGFSTEFTENWIIS